MKNDQWGPERRSWEKTHNNTKGQTLTWRWEQASLATLHKSLRVPGPPLAFLCCGLFAAVVLGTTVSLLLFASLREAGQSSSLLSFPWLQIFLAGCILLVNIYVFFVRKREKADPTNNREELPPTAHLPVAAQFGEETAPPQLSSNGVRPVYSSAHIELVLTQIFAKVLDLPRERVNGESDFFLCGGDSDALTSLLTEIEQRLRIHLEANDVFDRPTLARLVAFLAQKQPGQSKGEPATTREAGETNDRKPSP